MSPHPKYRYEDIPWVIIARAGTKGNYFIKHPENPYTESLFNKIKKQMQIDRLTILVKLSKTCKWYSTLANNNE